MSKLIRHMHVHTAGVTLTSEDASLFACTWGLDHLYVATSSSGKQVQPPCTSMARWGVTRQEQVLNHPLSPPALAPGALRPLCGSHMMSGGFDRCRRWPLSTPSTVVYPPHTPTLTHTHLPTSLMPALATPQPPHPPAITPTPNPNKQAPCPPLLPTLSCPKHCPPCPHHLSTG